MRKNLILTFSFVLLACLTSYAKLYINEVNSTGKWIEIYNSGDNEVDVSGYMITRNNNDNAVATATIPDETYIASKGFLVIFQGAKSGGTASSPVVGAIDCQIYGISSDKFMSAVLKDDKGNIIDDSFDIGNPQTVTVSGGKSWARQTDGAATILDLEPTPGKENGATPSYSDLKVYINEVNSTGKWIEIYNDEDYDVNLGRFTVTRNNYDGTNMVTIPLGTFIEPKSFTVIYQNAANGGPNAPPPAENAIDCLTFGISTDRFMGVVLKDGDGKIVDNTFDIGDPQTVKVSGGKSWARESDGAAAIVALEPTPGKSNTAPQLFSDLKIYINEVNSTSKWIEIYNDEDEDIDIGQYTVTRNNNDGTNMAVIPQGTVIAAKGFTVIYQNAENGGPDVAPPTENAIDCLTFGISTDRFMSVVLKDSDGKTVDNTFDIGDPQTVTVSGGKSWARENDGAAAIDALEPTPGKSNTAPQLFSDLKIYINEVNSTGKWIEIYNDEDESIDIGQYTITRNNNDGTNMAVIPQGTVIAAKGFTVIYQNAENGGPDVAPPTENAIDCMTFGISTDRFMNAILKDAQGKIVDNTFDVGNPQTVTVSEGKSWARETDGAEIIAALNPTPGRRNDGLTGLISEKQNDNLIFVYAGVLILPEKTSYIQLYSISGSLVLEQNVTGSSVDLTNLPKGSYVVKLEISGKTFIRKIIK